MTDDAPIPLERGPGGVKDPHAPADELRQWSIEHALPLWASNGWDPGLGAFHERLYRDGTPDLRASRRLRVQARQIYVYSHAAALGWYPDGAEIALRALESLLRHYRSPDGAPGYAHRISADGAIESALRDTYDHAFILLGFAWLARASGDAQVCALIDDALAFIDEHLASGDGTFYEGFPPSEPRRQNPHMHMFEAMLALHETIAHPQALPRAASLRSLLASTFMDPTTRTLTEYFAVDWSPWPGSAAVEPGHHAEWAWLLRRHGRMTAQGPDPLASHLLEVAARSADRRSGLLPDAILPDGSAHSPTHRCWPQAELAKAWLAVGESADGGAAAEAISALSNLKTYYLAPAIPGGWIDQVSGSGAALSEIMPASTFYHLFSAIAEADRVLRPRLL